MFLNQAVDPLETRNDVLQCTVASLSVRLANIEARDRPCCSVCMIDDGNDDDTQDIHAIEAAQFGDDQLRDLFFRFWQFFHASRPVADISLSAADLSATAADGSCGDYLAGMHDTSE
jgi:hypothetical protein